MNTRPFASPENQELLVNRYQLKQLIGKGGMGEVFLAHDILLGGTPVAIKFLSQTVVNPKIQASFNREALLSAALSQKSIHIVRAYDYGVSQNGKPFYVMEYLSGKILKELIPISLPMFFTLLRQICLGLQCAHQGTKIDGINYQLVHRDIKPANIIVIPDPILGQLAKILDFGIAKFLNSSTAIHTKGFHGTLPYCSPEQLDGEELDGRSDIYSLGVMMFEMLTGQKPWQPETNYFGAWYKAHRFEAPKAIADANPYIQVPQKLNDLIMTCLAKKPENRPQNIAQILQILSDIEKSNQQKASTSLAHSSTSHRSLVSKSPGKITNPYEHLVWPENKPIQEIVFPQMIDTAKGYVAALWLMLPEQEIKNHAHTNPYNQFIFITSPHPMLLWLTVLYNRELGPKWLPCYLDMQNTQNLQMVSALAASKSYPLIFFTLEPTHKCFSVIRSAISPIKGQKLTTWIQQSQQLPSSSQPQVSKKLLKQQYKLMQSQILQKIESKTKVVG
ncbi:serine/threonine protein kinase [Anabaena cylindrica FACHB-243]|uniref:Serine/threonine protein kinase n=1 Tax=Anabaena cylindrica (strain ATCC 27899 / PCC 7122) TaxID=272123 RepID=K9ZKD2_ANACC|nr:MULTISPECIES: serine/threonine-protein kinase [Anabaena]AFZ58780.1 serine/threonine protein kinase [Anabaena cylindrica PCC 7122]MBD2420121.1 serine/threonine protein kinase [Anabaena cylindrica FACHB-243]MBY5285365.1 serine/threonine protein kinase [Anabaena sp. CCAP 1446/1C]MBY5306594.1 serine/threonine protein kinase [Anabaena sp. CCAP 1446/1C]MCM2406981.1 serine/threonine protein kinase [Anabaena sp. CCAP 1446/1C]